MTIKFDFNFNVNRYPSLFFMGITIKMDVFDRVFGRPRTSNNVVTTPPPTESKSIELQRDIDKYNRQIETLSKEVNEKQRAAKNFAIQGNRVMAGQMLSQIKRLNRVIATTNLAVDQLNQKIMMITESEIIANVHVNLESANTVIKGLNSQVDVTKMQNTLIDNETIEDGVNELVDYMKDASPYATEGTLDAEIDKLIQDADNEDITYDFPDTVKQPIRPFNTTNTTTTTKAIPKSNLFESLL